MYYGRGSVWNKIHNNNNISLYDKVEVVNIIFLTNHAYMHAKSVLEIHASIINKM